MNTTEVFEQDMRAAYAAAWRSWVVSLDFERAKRQALDAITAKTESSDMVAHAIALAVIVDSAELVQEEQTRLESYADVYADSFLMRYPPTGNDPDDKYSTLINSCYDIIAAIDAGLEDIPDDDDDEIADSP